MKNTRRNKPSHKRKAKAGARSDAGRVAPQSAVPAPAPAGRDHQDNHGFYLTPVTYEDYCAEKSKL